MKSIVVEHLTKTYQSTVSEQKEASFRELLLSQAASLFRASDEKKSLFNALEDVSFEVQEGQVLGVIGKNGSGKSTLLKILSKITPPTSGKVTLRGRVASLLEVGTGFHAELTGRENIYLSGIISGMKRWEISQHFDEIVAFSGVEQFLDIPVKKYSSGMRLRLAFSIAAHLRSEILLMDEVLAVGDYEFEKKCLASVSDLSKTGRTILFVSHNILSIRKICSHVMVLNKGVKEYFGLPFEGIQKYLGINVENSHVVKWADGLVLSNILIVHSFGCMNAQYNEQGTFDLGEKVVISCKYDVLDASKELLAVVSFYDSSETLLFSTSHPLNNDAEKKDAILFCTVPSHIFEEGVITVGLKIFNKGNKNIMMDFDETILFSEQYLVSFSMQLSESQKKEWDETFWQNHKGKIKPHVIWQVRG